MTKSPWTWLKSMNEDGDDGDATKADDKDDQSERFESDWDGEGDHGARQSDLFDNHPNPCDNGKSSLYSICFPI